MWKKYFIACNFVIIILVPKSFTETILMKHMSSIPSNIDNMSEKTNPYHDIIDSVKSSIERRMNNITEHLNLDEKLKTLSEKLTDALVLKMDVEEKITELTVEALKSLSEINGTTVIETKRILNYISRSLSGNIAKYAKKKSPPHVERLIYGLAQSASEIAIIAGMNDDKWIEGLSNNQKLDGIIRKKRSISNNDIENKTSLLVNELPTIISTQKPLSESTDYNDVQNDTSTTSGMTLGENNPLKEVLITSIDNDKIVFINQTTGTTDEASGKAVPYLIEKEINHTQVIQKIPYYENDVIDLYSNDEVIATEFDTNLGTLEDSIYQSPVIYDEISYYRSYSLPSYERENILNQKLAKLESKAKKALIYSSDIAYFTAASFISLRRALTASVEVEISTNHIKNGINSNHYLLNDLAKSAAKQSGKEAKNALSHTHSSEKAFKMAIKYTSQSRGIKSNYLAKRTLMQIIPLVALTKSLASISTTIAINSMVEANDSMIVNV